MSVLKTVKGSFSLWENHYWLCFCQNLYLQSLTLLSESLRLLHNPPDCSGQVLMTSIERGVENFLVAKTYTQKWVSLQKLAQHDRLTTLLLEFLLSSFSQTYLCHYQHCKPSLPNATECQWFFLFPVFALQAQYYQACNMTSWSIFINNLSHSAHKVPLHPLGNPLRTLIQL